MSGLPVLELDRPNVGRSGLPILELDPPAPVGRSGLPILELDPPPQITANPPQITANPPEITANTAPVPGPSLADMMATSVDPTGFSLGAQPTIATLPSQPDAALQALQTPPPPPVSVPMVPPDPMGGGYAFEEPPPQIGDRDLEGQRMRAVLDPVSLGERLRLNASDAFYGGTLAGSNLLIELQQAARMTPQEWAAYNTAVRYAGGTLKPLPRPEVAQAELARIAAQHTRYQTIPGSEGPLELGAAITGQLAGGLPSPEIGINRVPGVGQGLSAVSRAAPVIPRAVERVVGEGGRGVAGRVLESGLSQGVVNAATDPLAQVGMIQTGMEPGYDPVRTALALPAGVVLGGALHGATEAGSAAASAAARRLSSPLQIPTTLTPAERAVSDEIARGQLDPGQAQLTQVGQPAPRVGPGDFPQNAGARSFEAGGPGTGELVPPGDYQQAVVPGTPRTAPAPEISAPPEAAAPGLPSEPAAARPASAAPPVAEPPATTPGLGAEAPRVAAPSPVPEGPGREVPGVAPEPRPTTAPEVPAAAPSEPRITTEPDHLDPARSVAKNEAGEVIGKGATPEEAMANARERGGQVYPAEPAAAAPGAETPAKRPVTKAEHERLYDQYLKAEQAFQKAENDPRPPNEAGLAKFQELREKRDAARAAYENAEPPPGRMEHRLNVTQEEIRAAAAEHDAKIEARIHAEGKDPTPEPGKAGQVFSMGGGRDQQVVRGTDTKGNTWVGNGYALVKGKPLERAATAAEKRTTTTTRTVDPAGVSRVTTPDPRVTYEPVTWERQVTDTDGKVLVIGTRADGSHVVLQKPIFDALHAAAGKDGELVSGKGDDRVWARAGKDYTGVGMPINVRQEQARAWARGAPSGLIEGGQRVPRQTRRAPAAEPEPTPAAEPVAEPTRITPEEGEQLKRQAETEQERSVAAREALEADKYRIIHEPGGGTEIRNQARKAENVKFVRIFPIYDRTGPNAGTIQGYSVSMRRGETVRVGPSYADALETAHRMLRGEPAAGQKPAQVSREISPAQEQLEKLTASRDALANKVRTPAEERKFQNYNRQIEKLQRTVERQTPAVQDQAFGPPRESPFAETQAALDRNRAIVDAAREQAEARQAELSPAERAGIRLNEGQQETGMIGDRGGPRRGGVKQPFEGPPQVGRERDFLDFKFQDGTSVYHSVLAEAGYDPAQVINWPIDRQVPIMTTHLKNTFGFSDVTVSGARGQPASRVDQFHAMNAMLDATRAFKDGMASLGLPYEAASLHGKLKLEIVPAGSTNWYGQYVFDGTIRLQANANSYGHEWTHAIDHLTAERFTGNPAHMNTLLSRYGRHSGLNVTDNVQAAFAKVINTMFYEDAAFAARRLGLEVQAQKVDKAGNPTKKALEAQAQLALLDAGGSKLRITSSEFRAQSAAFRPKKADYYASVYEMLARAHEAYMANKMMQNGVDPRGIVMPDEAYIHQTDEALRMLYPKDQDRADIFKAFDEWHEAMNKEAVLSNGKPAGDFADYGISDPHHWPTTAPNSGKTPLAQRIRTEINRYKNLTRRQFVDLALNRDPNRPAPLPGHSMKTRLADMGRTMVYSYHAMMKVMIERAPPEAKKILQPLLDSVATDPGSGRGITSRTFEEATWDQTRTWARQYSNILKDAGYDPEFNTMTFEERAGLRHFLVTGETRMPDLNNPGQTVPIPNSVIWTGGEVRKLLNRVWKQADNAGLDIGYAKNGFFPRIYDRARAAANPAAFKRQAGKLYSLMFDNEVGRPGADPQALWEKWNQLPGEAKQLAGQRDPDLPTKMGELNENLKRQREIEATEHPTPAERAELNKLKAEAEQLGKDTHGSLRDYIAEVNAADWHANLVGGELTDFDTGAPSGKYLNARVLPPEADIIMAEGGFLNLDPHVVLPSYFHSVSRRIAQAERFGPNEEVLKDAVAKLNRIEGMNGDDTTKFMDLIRDITGRRNLGGMRRWFMPAHNLAHASAALVTMERAVWASLAEPMVMGLVTGSKTAGFRNMGYTIGQLIGTASSKDRTALAEFLNVTTSPMMDSIMLSRMGADVNDQPGMDRLFGNYYRTTLLTQVTNGQRAASVGTANWFLQKLGQLYLDKADTLEAKHGREDAARWFRELGTPDRLHESFSQWLVDLKGELPSIEQLTSVTPGDNMGGMGDAYKLAAGRLVDRAIQDPKKVDRAMLSGVPILGLTFQLMSFNYSFQQNVLNPAISQLEHTYLRARGEAKAAGAGRVNANVKAALGSTGAALNTATIVASMVGVATMYSLVRQMLFAPDQVKKHAEDGDLFDYVLRLGVSRSGLNGVLDPVLQALNHLKYDSDLTSMVHGVAVNWYGQNLKQLIQPLADEKDPTTNTAKWNQARAFYNLFGVPTAALGLTALGQMGPISRYAFAAPGIMAVTSPNAANRFANMVAGPKYQTLPEAGKPGSLPGAEISMPKVPGLGGGGAEPKKKGGPMSWVPWGLADDILIPAARYAAPIVNQLSGPVKAGVAIGAAGYAAYDYLKSTAPYRRNPNPPPKRATPL